MTEKFTNPQMKTWWTKRLLSDDYHCAGRLSERQLKLAAEGGFATIFSLFTYPDETNRTELYDSRFDLPSTSQTSDALSMCEDVHFEAILERGVDWRTESTVFKVKELVESYQKPILLYCDNSYASAFLLLAYHAYVTSRRENDEPAVSDRDVFRIGALLGYDFGGDPVLVDLVSKLTGNPRLSRTPSPDTAVSNWYDLYWIMKPVYKEFFICGQFQSNHLQRIAKVGLKVLINCRTGKPNPEETRQPEDVVLLNISGRVDTKGDLTNFFAEEGPNIPFTLDTWGQYADFMKNHPDLGPIMVHCKTGFRAGQLAILAAAYKYDLSSKWVLDRAAILGYKLASERYNKVLEELLEKNVNQDD
ncbi:hypothetical protein LSH36_77g03056 [Paralvinella palmiformis]|uniref:Uncharacterized protein n=1 Tax=Paralvinella palmiformis TaxID=53620 RepID=A0AAD9NB48_9ANNE|nr:hypothetical protein LSH36_77g03056 [Paralvinella palmiformis]